MARRRGLVRRWHRRWKDGWIGPGVPPERRRRNAVLDMMLFDDGIARLVCPNLHEVRPGVWRGAQPGPGAIRRFARRRGLRTILNLRGETEHGAYLLERAVCAAEGVTLVDHKMSSRRLPTREDIRWFDRFFAAAEYPLLIHCKSGADRSGFAAAIYLLLRCDATPAEALAQLSWRYLHFRGSAAGILHAMLAAYAADARGAPLAFRDWVETRYDPEAITAAHAGSRLGRGLADHLLRRE